MKLNTIIFLLIISFISCKKKDDPFDASGTFEAVETIISAEVGGVIRQLDLEEGQQLKKDQLIGYIDTMQLYLKKEQLLAQIKATGSRIPNINVQADIFKEQLKVANIRIDHLIYEQKRVQNLVKADAATPKQLDDINAQITEAQKQLNVIKQQEMAQVSTLNTQTSSLKADVKPLFIQVYQINDQLQRSKIINPVNGSVLIKYTEVNEMAVPGKALYKIADLSELILRAYFSGDQLSQIKLGQKVDVRMDNGNGSDKIIQGTIEWISSEAEFTPKTILTKDERTNQVYAAKIKVVNDGIIKIGMLGEVLLKNKPVN